MVAVLVVALGGLAIAIVLVQPDRNQGALDTELTDVTVTEARLQRRPDQRHGPSRTSDRRCWHNFGGDPQRSLARPLATLGLPAKP